MFTASATRFGTRYAAPAAAASGVLLSLSLSASPPVAAKAEAAAKTVDVNAIKKSIAQLLDDDAERRGDGTSLTGTFVRVRNLKMISHEWKQHIV